MYEPSGANLPASDVYFSSFWRCCSWASTFLSSSFTFFWRSFISLCTWSTFFSRSSALFLRSSCPASTFFLRSSTFFWRSSWPASTFLFTSCLAFSAFCSTFFFASCLDWSGTSPHPVATPTSNSPATIPSSNTRTFVMCASSSPSRIRAIAGCPRGRLDQLFGVVIHKHDLASHTDVLADKHEPAMDFIPGAIWRTLFTGVHGREFLRRSTSALRRSKKLEEYRSRSASGSTPSLPSTPPPDRPLSPAGPPVCATSATPGPGLRPPAAPRVAPHLPRRHQRWCPASPPSGGRARHCSLVGRDRRACHAVRWSTSPHCLGSRRRPQRAPPSGAPRGRRSPPN